MKEKTFPKLIRSFLKNIHLYFTPDVVHALLGLQNLSHADIDMLRKME